MADVARLAGVSHQTVSRVLNAHPHVSPATRGRVEDAIAELGYRRNTAARALVTRSSRTIGVVSVDTAHFGPSSTLFAIEGAARAADYFVNFVSLRQVDRQSMQAAVDHLLDAGVDAVAVIAPLRSADEALQGVSAGVPLVEVAATHGAVDTGIGMDQVAGAAAGTRHLLELGHPGVLHLAGPPDWLEAAAREAGWRAALRQAGRPVRPPLVGDWSARSGHAAGAGVAAAVGRGEVTAVFVANDQMALGLMHALAAEGVAVPRDVSVVGFDDVPEAAYFQPSLTTLRQDFAEVGRRCVEAILGRLAGRPPTTQPPVVPELLVRQSTAPRP